MNKGIYGIIGILFIWLCLNTSNIASNSKDIKDSNTEISKIVKKLVEKPKRQIKTKIIWPKFPKPYLGGYKNGKNGKIYHNAFG